MQIWRHFERIHHYTLSSSSCVLISQNWEAIVCVWDTHCLHYFFLYWILFKNQNQYFQSNKVLIQDIAGYIFFVLITCIHVLHLEILKSLVQKRITWFSTYFIKSIFFFCTYRSNHPKEMAGNFIEKESLHRCFSVNFGKFLRTPFLIEGGRFYTQRSVNVARVD